VERPGANDRGRYHYSGGAPAPETIAALDPLYDAVRGRGALTIAIGDRGNELGMGAIADAVRAETPAGANCGCGCGGGTACPRAADWTVVASTSDWGAYAIAAALAHLQHDPAVLIDGAAYRRVLHRAVEAGAIDGPTKYATPWIDGVDEDTNAHLLELLRGAVAYPNREARPRNRLYRARPLLSTGDQSR
ncbi:MAG: glutamate cyclase domain-containing protein, partial [Candidatus Dormiibacterota bacterium]